MPTILVYRESIFVSSPVPDWILQLENKESNVAKSIDRIVSWSHRNKDVIVPVEEAKQLVHSEVIEIDD